MKLAKSDWILLLLHKLPLDRIRLMKILFLIQRRSKNAIKDYFVFEPYFYGPCSFELYTELRDLLDKGFISQSPHPIQEKANYYLTTEGKRKAEDMINKTEDKIRELIDSTVEELANLKFYELLKKIYQEAPEFAVNSVVKGVMNK